MELLLHHVAYLAIFHILTYTPAIISPLFIKFTTAPNLR